MRSILFPAFCFLLLLGSRSALLTSSAQKAPARTADNQVDRGRYLVEEVAKCSECHTPRDADNQLDRSRWLEGASTWIEPVHHIANWAQFAPPLAGLPSLSDVQTQRVLEMGQSASGREIQPPMHLYHLTHADAQAIIAYLRSLRPSR